MKPTLLIMAAGMGSRFGGLKQMEPLGPNGEAIIDYSVYDAIRVGFGKVVFVIRESFADAFKKKFDTKLKDKIKVEYVYQELDKLPNGFLLNNKRKKPWGTAHAILIAKDVIKEPFCVINADDFYGYRAYKSIVDFLTSSDNDLEYAMVGFRLDDTLSNFGFVSRGICDVDNNQNLIKVVENKNIKKHKNKIISIDDNGNEILLSGKENVSMNIWGFKPTIFEEIEKVFKDFLIKEVNNPKSELLIPSVIFKLMSVKKVSIKLLDAKSAWFGVTYKKDKQYVTQKINMLVQENKYPKHLF